MRGAVMIHVVMIGNVPGAAFDSRADAERDAARFYGHAIVRTLMIGRPA